MKRFRLASFVALAACLPLIAPGVEAADNDISKVNGSVHVTADSPVGDVETVNGSIRIDDGVAAKDVETVNGSIQVGDRATVGSLETVNGGISLGQGATAGKIETVNGKLTFAEGAQVKGSVSAVNGTASLAQNAEISGGLANVNGKISLTGARVRGGIRTTTGDIVVGPGSTVADGILIEKPTLSLFNWNRKKPRVVIGPDATVTGTLRAEQEIDLYVSDRATIGAVTGAKAIMFKGDEPELAPR